MGDIDTGGIFAQLLGTLMLLEPEEQALIRGLVINRFRGDPALFEDGVAILEQRSGVPVLGVVPWLEWVGLAEEDAVALERPSATGSIVGCTIAVIQLPAIANFDDFDPLAHEPGVTVRYISRPEELRGAAAVILPGTKHTLAARRWLRDRGFDEALAGFSGTVVGICGGYQLLGERISDPEGVEGDGGSEPGLGLLPVTTMFALQKRTVQVIGESLAPWAPGATLEGYEIHMGRTTGQADAAGLARIRRRGGEVSDEVDGYVAAGGRVWGCYLHGLFANPAFRQGWLRTLGWLPEKRGPASDPYDRLADHVLVALNPEQLEGLLSQ